MESRTRATLLESLRDGSDPMAWDEFFDLYWPLIFGFARRAGCNDHTAEEIVQDVMLVVFQQRGNFCYDPARGRFRDWLGKVAMNKLAERRRSPSERVRGRGGESSPIESEPAADNIPADAAWEAAFEEGLLLALLHVVRQQVRPRTYQAFELFVLQELPGGKVAELTAMSRNAVYQARKTVMERLVQLGAPYRDQGHITRQIKQALQSSPGARVERLLGGWLEKTMRSTTGAGGR